MSVRKALLALSAFGCLLATAGWAQPRNLQIQSGFDLFQTLAQQGSQQSFEDCPIPGFVFEGASSQPLTGCELFMGSVPLEGVPLEEFRGVTVGEVDTIVQRLSTLDFGDPENNEDVTLAVAVELVALHLASVAPVEIVCDQGLTRWQVDVEIDDQTGPSTGEMEVTLEAPQYKGGEVASELNICPRVTFRRVDAGGSGSFEIFPCDLLCGPDLLGDTTWAFEANNPDTTLKIEDFTTSNFNFTEKPENSLADVDCCNDPDAEGCCPSVYPHQEATAAHIGCQPCLCAQDTQPPTLRVPDEPAPPIECREQGGTPLADPEIQAWLADIFCVDDLNNPTTCGPEDPDPPAFFPSSCTGARTDVRFFAEDNCGNRTTGTGTVVVQDTLGPEVTAGDGDFACLSPPNGGVHCFDQQTAPFDLDTIKGDFTADVCGRVADWRFVGCASDQPGAGDCTVAPDGKSFCVRSERDGSIAAGRRYHVEIEAEDECGNVGASEVIGFIHVPISDPNKLCIQTTPPIRPDCDAVPTTGEVPLTVSFSDLSTVTGGTSITSWVWDFESDGITDSTAQNPTFTYSTPGTFTPVLTLRIADSDLGFLATCPTITVKSLTAGCAATPTSGTVPLTVDFTDQSVAANTAVTSWAWDFDGDGIIDSTAQNPSFTYTTDGTFEPTLTVSDGDLTKTATCGQVVVDSPPPPSCDLQPVNVTAAPNGKFVVVPIPLTDTSGLPLTIHIDSIFQDEALDAPGTGNTCPDGRGVGTATAEVRAERSGGGDGRVYHVEFTATAGNGASCSGVALVCVPASNKPGAGCTDNGPLHASTGPCP